MLVARLESLKGGVVNFQAYTEQPADSRQRIMINFAGWL